MYKKLFISQFSDFNDGIINSDIKNE